MAGLEDSELDELGPLLDLVRDHCSLLSEAERTRGGTTTPFWLGGTISTTQANYDGNHTYGSGNREQDPLDPALDAYEEALRKWG